MRPHTGQFGSFDGLDNRREVFLLLKKLGAGLPDELGDRLRAGFLQGLIGASTSGFAGKRPRVDPCGPVPAYKLFVAITGCLGVPVEAAARVLEEAVRSRDEWLDRTLTEIFGDRGSIERGSGGGP